MDKVYTIYEAKTHLSRLAKEAKAGKTVYIGAFGKPDLVLHAAPEPPKQKRKIGVWDHKAIPNAYDYETFVGPDPEINALIEESIDRPFP